MTAVTKIVTTTAIIRMSVQDLRLSPETGMYISESLVWVISSWRTLQVTLLVAVCRVTLLVIVRHPGDSSLLLGSSALISFP